MPKQAPSCSQQPRRPPVTLEARPPALGDPLGPRRAPSPLECRKEAAARLWCLPSVADRIALIHIRKGEDVLLVSVEEWLQTTAKAAESAGT
eukprot:scaffold44372_cov58-Phaeocystis_antarctica.AAC.3